MSEPSAEMVSALVRAFREHDLPVWDGVARVALTAALSVAEPCSRCAELEAEVERLRDEMADMVPATWEGLISVIDRWYPADVFTGESGLPGPRLVVLARDLARLREAAQRVVRCGWGADALVAAITALRAVLESDGERPSEESREQCYRHALEAIANAEIPGVSGGPHGASAEVMEFAQRALGYDDV